jgi:hypothetical protein
VYDIFEQPRTLLIIAIVVFFATSIFRWILPEKRRWWQWLIPVLFALAGFALDWLVKTDLEKINNLIKAGAKAVEQENPEGIRTIISPDYSDSYHNTKEDLMYYCRLLLSQPLVEKTKKTALAVQISPPQATAALTTMTRFERESHVYQNFKPILLIKIRLYLQKQPDKSWLIDQAEVLELDRQPVNWRQIRHSGYDIHR